ncbi:GTPase ERA-like, chloroplastic [Nicotiana tomentosiformis]|uniref:GTPase ERA-like, chloroplastic n=1 Tax=Nicotiana tomentosiformis TaxID=4098 RepID=UPI00051B218C|nr:GTPase ERA-like, chloroplastic [Nicotiana tomentosiformis]
MRALCLNLSLFPATLLPRRNYISLIHSHCNCFSPSLPGNNGRFRLRATNSRRKSEPFLDDKEEEEEVEAEEKDNIIMSMRRSKGVIDTNEAEEEEEEGEEEEDSPMVLSLSVKPDRNMALLDDYELEELDFVPLDPNHRSGYVAVVGKPNVGKSTLSNQMVGQKLSIVTDKPQTTRHRVLGICSGPEYQMILYDTPGVIEKKMHKLDSMMMKNVRSAAVNADCVVVVVDACKAPEKIDEVLEEGVGDLKYKVPTLLVLNKKDLIKPGEIAKKLEWYEKFTDVDEVIPVSAKYGHGVEDIKDWILSKLPLGPAYYPKDIASEHPERFFVAEIVREKIFLQYRNEVPYACQVNVVSYKTRPNAKDFIQVEVIVEKNTQKIILIGKEGKALKLLATAARLDIEDFLQKKVFLEVEVKVKENWRQNEGLLKNYGYGGHIQAL